MDKYRIRYATNAIIIFTLVVTFAYFTTYIHELGHAVMVLICGGDVLKFYVHPPLSFDSISGYILTDLPYNVPIVIGGTLATSALAAVLCLTARRTILSLFMLCLSLCTLYNVAYALSGFNDFTWLVMYSWWTALLSLGFVILNVYLAQQGLIDMFEDVQDFHTLNMIKNVAMAVRYSRLPGKYPIKEVLTLLWNH
jgi:hypothetical protein